MEAEAGEDGPEDTTFYLRAGEGSIQCTRTLGDGAFKQAAEGGGKRSRTEGAERRKSFVTALPTTKDDDGEGVAFVVLVALNIVFR